MNKQSNLFGIWCWLLFACNAPAAVLYVDVNSTNPVAPYANWSTASTDIQSAIDAASNGDLILVTNGVYATGGRVVYGSLTNRVVINKAVAVQSVNGPAVTIVQGYQDPITTTGAAAMRCVFLTNGAALTGFTLKSGATLIDEFEHLDGRLYSGGGVYCASSKAVVSNCVISGCSAYDAGGGAIGGTLIHCILTNCSSYLGGGAASCELSNCLLANSSAFYGGGIYDSIANNCQFSRNYCTYLGAAAGAYYSTLTNCSLIANSADYTGGADSCTLFACILDGNLATYTGGGAGSSTLYQCTLTNNTAGASGGGAEGCTLNMCVLAGNSSGNGGGADSSILNNCSVNSNQATNNGGGAESCTLNNSSLAGNTALYGGGADGSGLNNCVLTGNTAANAGGGAENSTLNNCIVYFNSAPSDANYSGGTLNYCCSTPDPGGTGNITNEPVFVDALGGDLRLQSNSPCINAGNNSYVTTTKDLDGKPRIKGGTVDIGAYEYQTPSSVLSYAWAQQYGFPTDGSADYADGDSDGLNNWQEWIAGTIPTNAVSVLLLASPSNSVSGLTVTWQSVTTRTYYLQSSTNLPAFTSLQSNLVGQAGTTSYTDTTATNGGPYFYRVGVQ